MKRSRRQSMKRSRRQFDEGQGEAHRQWSEWLQRKMEAEAKGELFEEPHPNSNSNGADGA